MGGWLRSCAAYCNFKNSPKSALLILTFNTFATKTTCQSRRQFRPKSSSIQADNLAYLEMSVILAIAAAFPSKRALQQAVNENSILQQMMIETCDEFSKG